MACALAALIVAPAAAASASGGGTETNPLVDDLELRSIPQSVHESSDSDAVLQEIHPWDNPQRQDSTHARGPSSELRPIFDDPPVGPPVIYANGSEGKATGIAPEAFGQLTNYPNPFNAETRIQFRLAEAGPVTLTIYNLLGQAVERAELGRRESGAHEWTWNGMLEGGRPAPSGIYFYRIESGAASAISKMVLLK